MRRVGPLLLLASVFAGASAGAEPPPPRTIAELRARIARVLLDEGVPGAGLALVADGRVFWAGGVGAADVATGRPVDADTLFRVGSITKSVVALALVKLYEERRIDLRARVADLAPEIEMENGWSEPITVAHLLEHTAGFDDMRPNEMYAGGEDLPLAAVLARNPRSRRARWAPGSRMSYANPGYTVAAYLIEKVAGRSYEDYIADEILRPLGMPGARLRWSPEVDARLARGYDRGVVPYAAIYHRPAGNLLASPRDLAHFINLWIHRGRPLVSAGSIARMERSETLALGGTDIDYGLGNYGDVSQALPMRGHDGGIDGFVSSYRYAAAEGIGYAVLLNSTGSGAGPALSRIRALMLDYLLGGRKPAVPPPVPVPDEALARWAGTYRFDSPRNELFAFLTDIGPRVVVRHQPGRLLARLQGGARELELVPLGGNRFRFPGESGASVAFAGENGGRAVFAGGAHFAEESPALAAVAYHGSRAVMYFLWSALLLPMGWFWSDRPRLVAQFLPALALFSIPFLLQAGARERALGDANVYTIGICALTWAFAGLSGVSVWDAVRRPLPLVYRLYAVAFGVAAGAATLFLGYYGMIGIRLWLW